MITITETRYWYNNQTPEKKEEIQETIGFRSTDLNNSVYEKIRSVYSHEIISWFDAF